MITAVSGFWITPKSKNDISKYLKWFENTLKINCPYIFFYSDDIIYNTVKQIRDSINYPTHFIKLNIEDFYVYKYKDTIKSDWIHCPSVELNLIWNQKVFLMQIAKNINIFNTDYFIWLDAGLCEYRETQPPINSFPDPNKLLSLPKDKFIFTSSEYDFFIPNVPNNHYYHYISGTYLLHKDFIDTFVDIYKKYIDIYLSKNEWIYTEQVIYTIIYKEHPELFHKIGHGFGKIIQLLI